MGCPFGGKESYHQKFVVKGYRIMECDECQHAFTDLTIGLQEVEKIYSDDYFFGGKDGYPDYTLEKEVLIRQGENYARLMNKYMKPGMLLDVGAAAGYLMKGFENSGWKTVGIEPNIQMATYGKDKLGLDIRTGTLETNSQAPTVDLVLLIQVIAHLYDMDISMRNVAAKVKEGGYVLVETWDKNSWMARLFGSSWHEYSPPTTLNYFSKKSLDILMERYGLLRIARGRPAKNIHGEHARSLLRYKLEASENLKWLCGVEKIIPKNGYIPYPAEDLFWALYQKNPETYENKPKSTGIHCDSRL